VSKRKKPNRAPSSTSKPQENESLTTGASPPSPTPSAWPLPSPEVLEQTIGGGPHDEPTAIEHDPRVPLETDPDAGFAGGHPQRQGDEKEAPPDSAAVPESIDVPLDGDEFDAEMTVNLVGNLPLPDRNDLDAPTVATSDEALAEVDRMVLQRKHLRGLLESLIFAADAPIKPNELAKLARAALAEVKEHLVELKQDYSTRGIHLDEVAGGWVFRTSPEYAPFVRDLTKQKPVRLTRAQVETLAIIAYRQPITRPEIDDVRGVDTGPVLKVLLERDLVRILGKRDEPGRPLIYGTTGQFLEFFGLKSLKDLPTLREFTELSDESRELFQEELGESPEDAARRAVEAEARVAAGEDVDDESGSGERGETEDPRAADDDGPTLTSEATEEADS
jgi:segregation and condensation protein B